MASNVKPIEPNDVNINMNMVNGIPQYQDMYIFAELTATRKGRTVLVSIGNLNEYSIEETGLGDTKTVNFLGNNQDITNPNYLNFTTNYYDGSNGNKVQYEGFGISNIKIVTNSSFIPQINIQFVDIRGLAFFNREDSPYRILFDFPPPIFNLTIKGYYGKALKYQIHLVKYTSEFKAENGNFIIDAEFVAVTFAPLADILFRYIINFPLINNPNSINPNSGVKPNNTYELITKLRSLYSKVSERIKGENLTRNYDNIIAKIRKVDDMYSALSFYNMDENLNKNGIIYTMILDKSQLSTPPFNISINNAEIIQLKNNYILNYADIIKEFPTANNSENINKRLYIANICSNETSEYSSVSDQEAALKTFSNKLINNAKNIGLNINIPSPIRFTNNYNISLGKGNNNEELTYYVGIDITDLFFNLYREKTNLNIARSNTSTEINIMINGLIEEELGMLPTIYNIFKIILDDVDTFFNILREKSNNAEEHHNEISIKNQILSSEMYKDIDAKKNNINAHIFAFPLVVNKQPVSGGFREVRIAPIELSKSLEPNPFPEITLVNNFIDTFFLQKKFTELLNQRDILDEDGKLRWIPISPIDSQHVNDNTESPYMKILCPSIISGEISLNSEDELVQIFNIMLKRFYVLSQYSFLTTFYENGNIGKAIIELFSNSEAINLVSSITDIKHAGLLKEKAKKYINNIEFFYDDLEKSVNYNFNETEKLFFSMSDNENDPYNDAYVDKKNSNYKGLKISFSDINFQENPDNKSNNLIDVFITDYKNKNFLSWVKGQNQFLNSIGLTDKNVIYVKDDMIGSELLNFTVNPYSYSVTAPNIQENQIITNYEGIVLRTKFLTNNFSIGIDKKTAIDLLSESGNIIFKNGISANIMPNSNIESINIIDMWVNQLSHYDDEIYNTIINTKSKLGALLYLSNFGYTLGPFNDFPNKLNTKIFNIPAVISVPAYLPPYMGVLIDAINGNGITETEIYDFFTTGAGKNLSSSGLFIFADIYDIKNHLSENDKLEFKKEFDNFYNGFSSLNYNDIFNQIKLLYDDVNNIVEIKELKKRAYESDSNLLQYINAKKNAYGYRLIPNSGSDNHNYYDYIIKPLITRTNIINFSDITFNIDPTIIHNNYQSLNSLNKDTIIKPINDNYFKEFFSNTLNAISDEEKKLIESEKANDNLKNDDDIITQTYYSFKNINDKWLSSPNFKNINGFPFNNDNNNNLIKLFAFVDRAMNPIGDTMINAEVLLEMFEDPNISVFTALSQLLSLNGFEFFPLQNFMSYDDEINNNKLWEESFKIDTSGIVNGSPAYVCMFIGGSSSYPTNCGNGFTDDSIIDLETADSLDFNTTKPAVLSDDEINNPTFPYRQVKAFKVRFGEQNQSMFTDIKIESKEYPDTNESIQILSRLAGDMKDEAPVPKGQNLYNLYENRAYRATITGMGNAMIQPTQYFQLENVPLFNGAYLILSVEHTIELNKMMTNFSGTKILRYPVPRVMNPAAIYGFEGGFESMSPGETIQKTQAITMSQPRLTELKSVFGIDISHYQGNINWNKIINNPNTNEPEIKFAFIKVTQGTNIIDNMAETNATQAKNAGLKISYYHFGEPYTGQDIVGNAKAQANYFINTIITKIAANKLPEPDFPLILDFENNDINNTKWSINKTNNNLWINTFITELKKAKYNTILYGGKSIFEEKTNNNFSEVPLWFAGPIEAPNSPEMTNPIIPSGWKNWIVWQFSWQGRPYGHHGDVDLNAMKEDYFNSPKLT